LTPAALMTKAARACASARILLDLNDVDGACNRAYYAISIPPAPPCWLQKRPFRLILAGRTAA